MSSRRRREIDRRYLFGDTLIKAAFAAFVFLAVVALLTPFTLRTAAEAGAARYGVVMAGMGLVALALLVAGRRLRDSATQLDRSRD